MSFFKVCDFSDLENLPNLESALVQINPREVVLPQSDHNMLKKVHQVLERNRILVTTKPNSDFVPLDDGDVQRLCNKKSNIGALKDNPLANNACAAVFKYLGVNEAGNEYGFRHVA